jgi:hypothetical protein
LSERRIKAEESPRCRKSRASQPNQQLVWKHKYKIAKHVKGINANMVSPQSKEKRKQLPGALTRLQGHEKYSRGQSHRF